MIKFDGLQGTSLIEENDGIFIYADENESKTFTDKKEALEYYLLALTTPTESDYEEASVLDVYKKEVETVKKALKELQNKKVFTANR